MVMAAQFKSLIDPFIIMFSIPMGFPGVIIILFLTGTTLSTTSFMGMIMMLGIVVSNGVLLVDYTNVLRRRGLELHEAVVKGAQHPAPSHLDDFSGHDLWAASDGPRRGPGRVPTLRLARSVIGGLTVSTTLTLFLGPGTVHDA